MIDFTGPGAPREIAAFDALSDNWAAYWYEGPTLQPGQLTIYGSEGVEMPQDANGGFQVFAGSIDVRSVRLDHLNPQTQERVLDGGERRNGRVGRGASIRQSSTAGALSGGVRSPRDQAP